MSNRPQKLLTSFRLLVILTMSTALSVNIIALVKQVSAGADAESPAWLFSIGAPIASLFSLGLALLFLLTMTQGVEQKEVE